MLILLLADLPVRITSQPKDGAAWDDPTVIVAALGVAATLLAVLVALFGPAWNAHRRRPKIDVQADPLDFGLTPQTIADPSIAPTDVGLQISNAAGRDTAREIEVFVSAEAPDGSGAHRAARQVNLLFGRLTSRANPISVSIPAGFSRRVAFVALGHPTSIGNVFSRLRSPTGIRPTWAR